MTLQEAINHCKQISKACSENNEGCSADHHQLMIWLKELQCLQKVVDKKYLDGMQFFKEVYGEDFDRHFLIEIRRDLTGMFATPKNLAELQKIFGGVENRK